MMKKYFAALSATALIGVTPYALAASSTDLTVTGFITPAACLPTLSDGGMVDHGKISSSDLKLDKMTKLANRTLQLSVNCDAPQAFWMKPIDNRPGTDIDPGSFFGLGLINGNQKLGGFEARFKTPLGDGVAVQPINSYNNGSTWNNFPGFLPNAIAAFGVLGGPYTPIAIKDLTTDLEVRTWIARADSLDLTNEVALDGSLTVEVYY